MRTALRWGMIGSIVCSGCVDRAPGPKVRTGPALLSWITDLPIPDSATTVYLVDTFVEPNGDQHHQGSVEGTVKVDRLTFQRLWSTADSLGYQPVSSYAGPYRVPIMVAAPGGRFRLHGDLRANYMLSVLNPLDHSISVRYVKITGLP